jgi:hypothetical protein
MSRRIALSVIATVAALSATPAFADNDCFDQTACPPTEETLAREQRMLEDRTRELREQEAQAAAEALAKQRADEQRAQELAVQQAAARVQAVETQRAMERAAAEQAKREDAAAARAAQGDAAHEQQYAKEREAEEQRAAERRAQQLRAAEQQRMPNVIEPPAVVVKVPAAVEVSQPPKEPVVAAPYTRQPTILSNTTGIVPPISTVPAKKIARPAERYEDSTRPQKPTKRVADMPRPQPLPAAQPAPSSYEEPREPVRVVQRAPLITGSVPTQSPVISAPLYVNQGRPAGTVVIVKGATYEDGVTPAVTDVRPDPSMKFCQTEQRADGRYSYCNQGSYHAYGVNGYRPMGTYKSYRTTPGYISAQPGPRIISLQVAD